MMRRHGGRQVVFLAGLWLISSVIPTSSFQSGAQERLLRVNWPDPELQTYFRTRGATRARSLSVQQATRLAVLRLPVIAFDTVPNLVRDAAAAHAQPVVRDRTIILDESNPVWYEIIDTFGEITVRIGADLRIHHTFPDTYPINEEGLDVQPTEEAADERTVDISIFDSGEENVFEGVIVEYTLKKYPNIPYTVTIECPPRLVAECRDLNLIKGDQKLIQIISARLPD